MVPIIINGDRHLCLMLYEKAEAPTKHVNIDEREIRKMGPSQLCFIFVVRINPRSL